MTRVASRALDPVDLSLRILLPRAGDPADLPDLDLAFDLWYQIWIETRREV
jgi:hypothetical protein